MMKGSFSIIFAEAPMKKWMILVLVAILLVACNLPFSITFNANPTATPVEATAQVIVVTATPEATVAPQPLPTLTSEGNARNLGGVYMVIPPCLAADANGVIIPESNPGDDGPVFMANPEYRKITLTGYPLAGTFWEPLVQVYPVQRFVELAPNLSDTVAEMQSILADQPTSFAHSIPLLPIANAAQVFRAQISYINFQNGKGIGFLTEYAQYYAPVNNHDLFYTFQGLTSDNKYWVSVILPVNAAYLQPTYNDFTVPADGIPVPQDINSPSFSTDMEAYYVAMVQKLNSTSPDAFLPTLNCMASFIQTLNVGD